MTSEGLSPKEPLIVDLGVIQTGHFGMTHMSCLRESIAEQAIEPSDMFAQTPNPLMLSSSFKAKNFSF